MCHLISSSLCTAAVNHLFKSDLVFLSRVPCPLYWCWYLIHFVYVVAIDTHTNGILAYDISFQLDERATLLCLVRSSCIVQGLCVIADHGYFSCDLWREVTGHAHCVKRTISYTIDRLNEHIVSCEIAGVPSKITTWQEQGGPAT